MIRSTVVGSRKKVEEKTNKKAYIRQNKVLWLMLLRQMTFHFQRMNGKEKVTRLQSWQ